MSSSDITFNKVEKLLEEVQILQPSLESLFARAESMRAINKEALLLNRELSKNLKDFDEIIKNSINGELDKRLKELDKFNDLESNVNKNISYLRKEINKIQSFKTLKCILAMVLIASIYYFDKVNNIF
ncbi:MAG: hypothetical protein WC945_08255 [Bacteroidales bacterium]